MNLESCHANAVTRLCDQVMSQTLCNSGNHRTSDGILTLTLTSIHLSSSYSVHYLSPSPRQHGARHAVGHVRPRAVRRQGQRGGRGSGNFKPGTGYVAFKKADYAHALSRSDTDLLMLLFETYGGWSEPVVRLFLPDVGPGAEQADQASV